MVPASRASLPTVLALNRTVGIVLISVLFFGLGEQLWSPFLPAYLDAKTSSAGGHLVGGVSFAALLAVGAYACLRNLFEAGCYAGRGELTARLADPLRPAHGRRVCVVPHIDRAGHGHRRHTVDHRLGAFVSPGDVHDGCHDSDEDESRNGLRAPVDPEATSAHRRAGGRRSRVGRRRTTPWQRRGRVRHRAALARGSRPSPRPP